MLSKILTRGPQKPGKYQLKSEEVAVPEVRTGKAHASSQPRTEPEAIRYENVAVPEIHIPRKSGA